MTAPSEADAQRQTGSAKWTCTLEHGPLWYIELSERARPPYLAQREVRAIIDIDAYGKLAGIELIDDMPGPPIPALAEKPASLPSVPAISGEVVRTSDEVRAFLADVVGVVEADGYGSHMLWDENDRSKQYDWRQVMQGHGQTVGHIAGLPVHISLQKNVVGGCPILFYHATSLVSHAGMIEDWLKANLPPSAFLPDGRWNHSDAMNFCNVMHAARASLPDPSDTKGEKTGNG